MITASFAPQTTQGWNPELTLRPFFEQNQKHQRWDFSQAEADRISTPSYHQPPANNSGPPNYKNNKIKPSVSPRIGF